MVNRFTQKGECLIAVSLAGQHARKLICGPSSVGMIGTQNPASTVHRFAISLLRFCVPFSLSQCVCEVVH
jgi:hypothetical protein